MLDTHCATGWMSCDPRLSVLSRSLLTLARASSHTFNTSLLRTISTLYSNNLPPIQQIHTDSYLSTSSPNGTPHVEHSGHVSFLGEERSRFNESQEPHQFLSGDGRTVVCVHPTQPTPISESRVSCVCVCVCVCVYACMHSCVCVYVTACMCMDQVADNFSASRHQVTIIYL